MAVHIYTQTVHRTTQIQTNVEECGPCPVFAKFYPAMEKARKNLSQSKKTLSQVKKNLSQSKVFAILDFYNFILAIDTTVQNNDNEISLHFKPMRLIFMNYSV